MSIHNKSYLLILTVTLSTIFAFSFSFGCLLALPLFVLILFLSDSYCFKRFLLLSSVGSVLGVIILSLNFYTLESIKLFLAILFYFYILFEVQFLALFYFKNKKYGVLFTFLFVLILNFTLTLIPKVFPLYFTIGIYSVNMFNFITVNLLPLFTEGLFVSITVAIYQYRRLIMSHKCLLVIVTIVLTFTIIGSLIVKSKIASIEPNLEERISVGIVQGGFTGNDYKLSNKYGEFSEKITDYYMSELRDLSDVEFIVLPESSFLVSKDLAESYKAEIKEISTKIIKV